MALPATAPATSPAPPPPAITPAMLPRLMPRLRGAGVGEAATACGALSAATSAWKLPGGGGVALTTTRTISS